MAKRKKIRFGKQARFDHGRTIDLIKLAIASDDQFHLQIYSTFFINSLEFAKNYYGEKESPKRG